MFRPATPGYEFAFPRDHGSHPAYQTEWWYYTGHLRTAEGRRFGFEVTFFRAGVSTNAKETEWDLQQIYPAHFAVTDLDAKAFRYYEKLNRGSKFTADAAEGRLDVFNESWRVTTNPDGSWRLVAAEGKDALDLTLRARKAPAIHGENGVSIKAPVAGYASHYYSMTRLEAAGTINGAKATGQAWMDHEFGSAALRENQQGWDWFSIQLDNDAELMLYVIRKTDGSPDVTSSGSLISSDGGVIHLRREQMRITATDRWTSPKSKATYPMGWRIEVPSFNVALTVTPRMREQELITAGSTRVTYWEGAVGVSGTFAGNAVRGEGYVEMTGYDKAFRAP
ncbi:MAG TPA: lipocalin-like domain-containing protein [Thermoanaerobaculia bacterium]|nr:lipocalin-like domain-containing protein [Thermoanaerobaculia bacterium]